jgi:decaprenylphospho-beta-D-ribofuranose 2-oxidase
MSSTALKSTVTLTGWGRIAPTQAQLVQPDTVAGVVRLLETPSPAGTIARGLGRSYNNAAQVAGGMVISTARLNRIIALDPATGVVTCEAGVSLEQLMVAGLPHGWFVPVSPGTRQVTVGGAIAADVHGKNHHVAGSFARHVRSFDIVLPGGELRAVTEAAEPELFWATAGGMGLTGLVVRAELQLKQVETARIRVDTVRTADIDETMAVLAEHDQAFGYTVAWSDSLARGARLGRSVVTSGDFAAAGDLPAGASPFDFRPGARLSVPPGMPPGLINRYSVALANEAYYRKAPRARQGELQTIGAFFHPLDGIRHWNRVYGPGGFRQYQYVLPFGQEAAVRRSFELVSRARAASFVTVLKRFGAGDPGLLSFPMPGWTLALDVPARTRGLAGLLAALDRLVVEAGGRVYLAKDSRVPAEVLAEMYPRLAEFRKLREVLDPAGLLASDLSRRLAL